MNKQYLIVGLVALSVSLAAGAVSANSANANVGVVSSTTTIERPINTHTGTTTRPAAKYHRVRAGETLSRIAKRYNVSLKRLIQLNKLYGDKANHIKVGQVIRLS